ncbi:MAG: helix-hairpin-helix domain-containing protein [Putridiphycobacter sp.]|nr:helix-hairpin-helix domain-containing protein [Putridiphycobacter sp.]
MKPFNPNKLSKSEWKNLGFSEKQAQVIVSYKNKIGGFKSKSDIANCYVISDEKFQTIAPYIRFETEQTIAADSVKIEAVFEQIEINTATKSELESVKGIGPFYAKQILALRKDLGGYYSVEQLKEVYGMTQEAFEQIKPQLTVLPTEINKIEVSTAKFDALKRHPYLSWKQSQIIVSQKYKSIDSIFWSNLTNSGHFTESDIQRLKPYFK